MKVSFQGKFAFRLVLITGLMILVFNNLKAAVPGFWSYSGDVFLSARTFHDGSGHIYLTRDAAGYVQQVVGGQQIGNLVRLDESTGAVDLSFQWDHRLGAGSVAIQADGKIVVAVPAETHEFRRIVRVSETGASDPTYVSPVFDQSIRHLTLQEDGKLIVLTSQSDASGVHSKVYRVTDTGRSDEEFSPVEISGAVQALPLVDSSGKIYLAGQFNTVNGISRRGVARIGPDGTLDVAFADPASLPAGFGALPQAILLQGDGKVIFGGRFGYTARGHVTSNPILAVRFTSEGAFDTTFAQPLRSVTLPGTNSSVYLRTAVSAENDKFYAVCDRLLKFNADGSVDDGFEPIMMTTARWLSRSLSSGSLFVPGFQSATGSVAAFTSSGVPLATFNAGGKGSVVTPADAVLLNDGRLLATGSFNRYAHEPRPAAALFERDGNLLTSTTDFHDPSKTLSAPTVSVFRWEDGAFGLVEVDLGGTGTVSGRRFFPDGSVDLSWAPSLDISPSWHYAPTSDGGMLVWQSLPGRQAVLNEGAAAYLKKYLPNGMCDTNFAPDLSSIFSITRNETNFPVSIRTGSLLELVPMADGAMLLAVADVNGLVTMRKLSGEGTLDSAYTVSMLGVAPINVSSSPQTVYDPVTGLSVDVESSSVYSDVITDVLALSDGSSYLTGSLAVARQPQGLVRLLASGEIDPEFSGKGMAYEGPVALEIRGSSLAQDSLGRIYVAGRFTSFNGHSAKGLVRLAPNGVMDAVWNSGVEVRDYSPVFSTKILAGHGWLHLIGNVALSGENQSAGYLRVPLQDMQLPVIMAHPLGQRVTAGSAATFAVDATGATSYQWRFGGTSIPGETLATLTLASVDKSAAGDYSVVVTNATGSVVSNAAILAVNSQGFTEYLAAHFTSAELANPSISGPTVVYGEDGLSIFTKYALGLNPKLNASAGLPEVSTTATDWVFTYTRPMARSDVNYTVEVSSNLTTWTSVGVVHELISSAGINQTWRARVQLSGNPAIYFRLKVNSQ